MEELKALLLKHGINLSDFGKGKAKTLEHLLTEVQDGEAQLIERDGELIRHLEVLNIDVISEVGGIRWLVEDRQEFADGRRRKRDLPASVSEKLHAGEEPLNAVTRALKEELGISKFKISSPFSRKVESLESPSFPGLMSEYVLHKVDVLIDPTEHKPTYEERQADKTTFFVWR